MLEVTVRVLSTTIHADTLPTSPNYCERLIDRACHVCSGTYVVIRNLVKPVNSDDLSPLTAMSRVCLHYLARH